MLIPTNSVISLSVAYSLVINITVRRSFRMNDSHKAIMQYLWMLRRLVIKNFLRSKEYDESGCWIKIQLLQNLLRIVNSVFSYFY